jgi:hypothetical protein
MSKLTLNSIGSRYGSVDALNDNFDSIEEALNNTLSRDGSGPNSMEVPLDMNGQPILNASSVDTGDLRINGVSVEPGNFVSVNATVMPFEFTATAGQTSFSVAPFVPSSVDAVVVLVDGIELKPSTVSLSGSTVSFPALSVGQQGVVRVFTRDIGGIPFVPTANLLPGRAEDASGGPADEASFHFRRRANYNGGTPGFVNSAVRVDTFVEGPSGFGSPSTASSFEWALTAVVHNYSNAGENVGGYLQGRKHSTGPTWGATIEVLEMVPTNNPTTGTVALEIDVNCNGTDNAPPYGARVGVDLAIRKNPLIVSTTPAHVSWGFRIQGDAGAVVDRGYSFFPGMTVNKGFDTSTATVTQAAYVMAENQPIAFNAALSKKLYHDSTGFRFADAANTILAKITDTGAFQGAGGVQIIGARQAGWGVPTGTATRTTFATSSVTLEQLAQRVKALVDDLTLHGLIGA